MAKFSSEPLETQASETVPPSTALTSVLTRSTCADRGRPEGVVLTFTAVVTGQTLTFVATETVDTCGAIEARVHSTLIRIEAAVVSTRPLGAFAPEPIDFVLALSTKQTRVAVAIVKINLTVVARSARDAVTCVAHFNPRRK